jgi:hypothetical protein
LTSLESSHSLTISLLIEDLLTVTTSRLSNLVRDGSFSTTTTFTLSNNLKSVDTLATHRVKVQPTACSIKPSTSIRHSLDYLHKRQKVFDRERRRQAQLLLEESRPEHQTVRNIQQKIYPRYLLFLRQLSKPISLLPLLQRNLLSPLLLSLQLLSTRQQRSTLRNLTTRNFLVSTSIHLLPLRTASLYHLQLQLQFQPLRVQRMKAGVIHFKEQ